MIYRIGAQACQTATGLCIFLDGGYISPIGVIVNATGEERSVDLLRLGTCPNATPVLIAVGGGGRGGGDGYYVGGGGSGYVAYTLDSIPLGSVK